MSQKTEKQPHETALPAHVIIFDTEFRCRNCDSTVDENGKVIEDDTEPHKGDDPDWCPDCGATFRRIR